MLTGQWPSCVVCESCGRCKVCGVRAPRAPARPLERNVLFDQCRVCGRKVSNGHRAAGAMYLEGTEVEVN